MYPLNKMEKLQLAVRCIANVGRDMVLLYHAIGFLLPYIYMDPHTSPLHLWLPHFVFKERKEVEEKALVRIDAQG